MGLFSRKETGPRTIRCPYCGGQQEASASALSVVCRACNNTIKIGDQKISNYSATVALEICGDLTVEKKGALVAQKRVIAENLTLQGSLKGNAVIHDKAHLAAGAQMVGDLTVRVLKVEDGASLKGFLQIGPQVTPGPAKAAEAKVKA